MPAQGWNGVPLRPIALPSPLLRIYPHCLAPAPRPRSLHCLLSPHHPHPHTRWPGFSSYLSRRTEVVGAAVHGGQVRGQHQAPLRLERHDEPSVFTGPEVRGGTASVRISAL